MSESTDVARGDSPPRDRTHYLYLAVIGAVVLGIVVGFVAPDFALNLIPTTLFSALVQSQVLQTLLVALLVGFAVQTMGRAGEPVLRAIGHLQRLVFRILAMIMWVAPIGAFGAIAAVVGAAGWKAL